MRRLTPILLGTLALASCDGCNKCPAPPDMARPDLSRPADLAAPRDLSRAPDMSCIACNAVINPCPALHLFCDPGTRCCGTTPHKRKHHE